MRIFSVLIITISLQGCATGYNKFYRQVSPSKYPPTQQIDVFDYKNADITQIYNILFSNYLIIGKSAFNGPYENPRKSEAFAKSIGADIFITSYKFSETRTSFTSVSVPTANTTHINGYSSEGAFSGTATTYGTSTSTVPIQEDIYDQYGIFLKNLNNKSRYWTLSQDSFNRGADSEFDGTWANEIHKLNTYKSGKLIVSFIQENTKGSDGLKSGNLKFLFDPESKVGIYIMETGTPMPANFSINKFGHLEIDINGSSDTFSFSR